ncbi:hypothetical protein PMAYCL1PPCAC_09352, partial [Pristionchus mayeri]
SEDLVSLLPNVAIPEVTWEANYLGDKSIDTIVLTNESGLSKRKRENIFKIIRAFHIRKLVVVNPTGSSYLLCVRSNDLDRAFLTEALQLVPIFEIRLHWGYDYKFARRLSEALANPFNNTLRLVEADFQVTTSVELKQISETEGYVSVVLTTK